MNKAKSKQPVQVVRCAIYTRKSTEDGLELEFNSLQAQREAAEAYIASQRSEGWVALPDQYDDGGFSGGNVERPGLRRLLSDIAAGKIDCVVVYKVDRLSRSLLDFAKIMESFEKQRVSFVSVTQHFNTSNSMGRLTLNVLLSFAQFEREIIGERIRDKLAAQKRKGKWTGGTPLLGYDVDRSGPSPKLIVNPDEAERTKQIFALYLHTGSLLQTINELRRRGWTTKQVISKRGRSRGGKPFDKAMLYSFLTNPMLIGKIRDHDEFHPGEHQPIIEAILFEQVQQRLRFNGRSGGRDVRNRHGALLRGVLKCKACERAMTHSFTTQRRGKGQVYRYYICTNVLKNGASACPTGSLPAREIEQAVVDEVRLQMANPALIQAICCSVETIIEQQAAAFDSDRRAYTREAGQLESRLTSAPAATDAAPGRTNAEAHRRLASLRTHIAEINRQKHALVSQKPGDAAVSAYCHSFDGLWGHLSPREQSRVIQLLIRDIYFDSKESALTFTFYDTQSPASSLGAAR